MIPIRDSVPTRGVPWANLLLIALNVGLFLYELSLGSRLERFVLLWGAVPADILRWWAVDRSPLAHAPLTLVTSMFLHQGWLHLAGNMLFLWIFGDNVEERFGGPGYLVFYLLGGAAAALTQVVASGPVRIPLIGASGAIAAVLGAYMVMYPRSRVSVLLIIVVFVTVVQVPAAVVLGVWFLFQFLHGVSALDGPPGLAGGVGWWAHIGGFLLGLALAPLWPKRVDAPGGAEGTRRMPAIGATGWGNAGAARLARIAFLIVEWLLVARIALVLLHFVVPRGLGALVGALLGLTFEVTAPLVAPFAPHFRALVFDRFVLDVAAVVALLVYRLLDLLVASLLAGRSLRRAV